jgi:hypothetical protein
MLVPNTNTRVRCTGDDESAPKTTGTRPSLECTDNARTTAVTAVDRRSTPSLGLTSGRTATRTSADVSVPRLAGFSLITCFSAGTVLTTFTPPHSQPRALRHVTISRTSHETPLKSACHERLAPPQAGGAHHPSSCTPRTTSGSSGRARPAMIASQAGFRLGLGLASPKRKGTRRRHCLPPTP